MWPWLKDNVTVIGAIAGTIAALVAVLQVLVVNPMNRRFDDQNRYIELRFDQHDRYFEHFERRFDQQDERLDRLTDEVAELRALVTGIIERVSRNEGEIDVIRQQLQTVDTP